MPAFSTDRRAVLLVQALEEAGQTVQRVVIEGKRLEVILRSDREPSATSEDEFELVEMKK